MTQNEARKLQVGQRVSFIAGMNDDSAGTVREVSYAAAKIEWDDGKWGLFTFNDPSVPWPQVHLGELPKDAD